MFSKQVENTVGKGEIACYKQFFLVPQCFQKTCFPGTSNGVVWEWVQCIKAPAYLFFAAIVTLYTVLWHVYKAFCKHAEFTTILEFVLDV